MSRTKYGPIDQIGFVVEDLDATIRQWSTTMGLGPWTVFRNVPMAGNHRGQESRMLMDVAMAYQGDVQMEFIQPKDNASCPYRGADGELLIGMHHMAWLVDDLETTVDGAIGDGLKPVYRATSNSTKVAYLETPEPSGVLIEFIECANTRQLFIDGREAAKNWDGTNPITEIDFGA